MPPSRSESRADGVQVVARLDQHDDREGGVRGHVRSRAAGRCVCEPTAVGAFERERGVLDASPRARSCVHSASRAGRAGERGDRDARLLDERAPPVGVDRDDTAARAVGLEQLQLRREVVVHRRVVVEVVVAEVGEPDDVEDDAVDAVTAERLRGDLDGDGADAPPRASGPAGRAARSPPGVVSLLVIAVSPMRRSAVELSPETTPSWPRMAFSR